MLIPPFLFKEPKDQNTKTLAEVLRCGNGFN
jgi:hypothetical protein